MALNKLASVEKILEVENHSGADLLELVTVIGCKSIVPKGKHKAGDDVVFIWPDSILPNVEWAAPFNKKSSRVRAIKIRGEYSMGIVMFPHEVGYTGPIEEELEISEALGVTKYDPPPPKNLAAKSNLLPYGIFKTDESNYNGLRKLPWGEEVLVTRKRDGSSTTFFYELEDDNFGVTSRSLELKPDCSNEFTENIKKYNIDVKLKEYCQKHGVSIAIRGETFGTGMNSHGANTDAKLPRQFEVFNVLNLNTLTYFRPGEDHHFLKFCEETGIPHVPVYEVAPLTKELVQKYEDGEIGFEGVVMSHAKGSFKVINKVYDSKK